MIDFEFKQVLIDIYTYVNNAYTMYGDDLDHEEILSMIPDSIKNEASQKVSEG